MENIDLSSIKENLKTLLDENEGELPYWGDAIPFSKAPPHPSLSPTQTVVERAPEMGALSTSVVYWGRGKGEGEKAERLEQFRTKVIGDCQLCPLSKTRTKIVFGVGNPDARVMFIGEGPGFDEDLKGEPFVGKAGQLLDKILASIGLSRQTVYIANVVKCHPMADPTQREKRGNDRAPSPEEMKMCLPFLMEQIKIIEPEIIVLLGAVASKALLQTTQGISALRGTMRDWVHPDLPQPIKVLPTYHPAALLRDETLKMFVWKDMKLLRDALSLRP